MPRESQRCDRGKRGGRTSAPGAAGVEDPAGGRANLARSHLLHLGRELVDEARELLRLANVDGKSAKVQEPPREPVAGPVSLEPRPLDAARAVPALAALVGAERTEDGGSRQANVSHANVPRGLEERASTSGDGRAIDSTPSERAG